MSMVKFRNQATRGERRGEHGRGRRGEGGKGNKFEGMGRREQGEEGVWEPGEWRKKVEVAN